MSDLKINQINNAIGVQRPAKPRDESGGQATFDEVLDVVLAKLNQVQSDAEKAVNELAGGGDVFQAVVAMEKADMNFQLMVEVRNKLISAYEEIMRMQV